MKFEPGCELREFNCLNKEMENLYHEAALKAGLSDSSFFVLYTIVELGDGCLQVDVAKLYSISKQTVSSAVRNLEKSGYLTLKKGRGRDMHLCLTETGRRLIRKNLLPVMEAENQVFSAMTPEEGRELLRLSRKYVEIFREKLRLFLEREEDGDERDYREP